MGFRDLLAGAAMRASVEDPRYPLTSARLVELMGGTPTDSGELVTPKKALSLIAVYRAVSIVAGTAAMLEPRAYEAAVGTLNKTDVTERYPVLWDPHPEMTDYELWEWAYSCVELHGNAFLQKQRYVSGNKPVDGQTRPPVRYLLPVRPELVRVGRSSDGTKMFGVRDPETGEEVPATTDDILHIPGFGYDGIVGLSPIDLARQGLGTAMAAEKYAALLFGRGALMSGILQTDRRLPPGAADQLQARWHEMTSGLSQAHKVAVLDQGAKFQPIQITPEQAQFLETRKFSVIEVARLFGVPPHLLMETSAASNWGTGIEEQTRGFITFSLNYRLVRVARRISKELLPRSPKRIFCEHRTEELLQADTLHRYQAHSLALRDRWKTRAEVRREENLPVTDPALEEFEDPPAQGGAGGVAADDDGTNDGEPKFKLPRPGSREDEVD